MLEVIEPIGRQESFGKVGNNENIFEVPIEFMAGKFVNDRNFDATSVRDGRAAVVGDCDVTDMGFDGVGHEVGQVRSHMG